MFFKKNAVKVNNPVKANNKKIVKPNKNIDSDIPIENQANVNQANVNQANANQTNIPRVRESQIPSNRNTVSIPEFNIVSGEDKINSFFIDSLTLADSVGEFKPYFIGDNEEPSFKEHIKASTTIAQPSDLVSESPVMTLSRRS